MNIYPQDLSEKARERLIHWRTHMQVISVLGAGRYLEQAMLKQDAENIETIETAEKCLTGPHNGTRGLMQGTMVVCFATLGISFGILLTQKPHDGWIGGLIGGVGALAFTYIAKITKNRRVSSHFIEPHEASMLSKRGSDTLSQDYFRIIGMLTAMTAAPDAQTEQTLRTALKTLGDAIDKLPVQPTETLFINADTLMTQAALLKEQASAEPDFVIAASLDRQSDALTRRAETIARVTLLVRRSQILRDEVSAQLKAFQTSLNAAQVNGMTAGNDFAGLAASVAQVAQEANALSDARMELDAQAPSSESMLDSVQLGVSPAST